MLIFWLLLGNFCQSLKRNKKVTLHRYLIATFNEKSTSYSLEPAINKAFTIFYLSFFLIKIKHIFKELQKTK